MANVEPIVADTPEALAEAIGLPATAAWEWRMRLALMKRLNKIVRHADPPQAGEVDPE